MNQIPTREIGQVGLIVKDVEKASKNNIARLFELEGVDYGIIGEYEYANTMYKGRPTSAKAKEAFYQMGAVTSSRHRNRKQPGRRQFIYAMPDIAAALCGSFIRLKQCRR